MSLPTPPKVQKLQEALHAKAKGSPDYRFYALYDKVYRARRAGVGLRPLPATTAAPRGRRPDVRGHRGVRRGAVAGRTGGRTQERRRIVPRPVRRVYIPKPDGKQRPLGIPTIRDRVAQMAAVLVLEPIFEADLQPEQYAYRARPQRPGRRGQVARAAQHGAYGGRGRRPDRVLRQHPPRRTHEIGVPSRSAIGTCCG